VCLGAQTPVKLNATRFRDILMPDQGRRDDSDDTGQGLISDG
jgi:hypothetical protein